MRTQKETDLQEENERLKDENKALRNLIESALGALQYYTEVEYADESDVQACYGLEVMDEIDETLAKLEQIDDEEPHPDHCLCDGCVTPENMDERIEKSKALAKLEQSDE